MSSTRLITKSIVISVAILCVLSAAMPIVSASYGDVQRFTRPSPSGMDHANLWPYYMDARFNPPGRICTMFTLGIFDGENWVNELDSSEALAIGTVGFFLPSWQGFDHKSAQDLYANHEYYVYIDGDPIDVMKSPLRRGHFKDPDTGDVWIWWEWRCGATYKEGELADLIGLGEHTISFQQYEYGSLVFDSTLLGTYTFILV